VTDEPIPGPPGWLERTTSDLRRSLKSSESFRVLSDDFDHIIDLRKNAAIVLVALGAILGLLIGCILGGCCGSSKKVKRD